MIYNADVYDILSLIGDVRSKFIDEQSDTLNSGIYGYLGEVLSNITQNSVIMATEWGNEAFPIRAKLDRTNLTNAIMYGIDDLNATPASMKIWLGFIESELIEAIANQNNLKNSNLTDTIFGTFRVSKDCALFIENFEFHLDYDLLITRSKIVNTKGEIEISYSARYDIDDKTNSYHVKNITNPYLSSPIYFTLDGNKFVFINCSINQVSYEVIEKKMTSNNIIDNKTLDFEFEDQLAGFSVKVTEGKTDYYITAIPEGMPLNGEKLYCYYTYVENNRIRLKFDRASYVPRTSCTVNITLVTTQGSNGNFEYKEDAIQTLDSEDYDYMNLSVLIRPRSGSVNGRDRKTIEELKEIIPKEILSRGSISTEADLDNYFNSLENCKLHFFKRKDNQADRWYYAYLLVKDSYNNIVPTNTIPLLIDLDSLDHEEDRYLIPAGSVIEYDGKVGTLTSTNYTFDEIKELEKDGFIYTNPINIVINKDPLSISYYLYIMDRDYDYEYTFINNNSVLQFVSDTINMARTRFTDNKYTLSTTITQNILTDYGMVEFDINDNASYNIMPVMVITNGRSKYYVKGSVVNADTKAFMYDIEFDLISKGIIDRQNNITFSNLMMTGDTENVVEMNIPLGQDVECEIYLYAKFDTEYGRNDADMIIPGMEGYTLCNVLKTTTSISFYENYSEVITSVATAVADNDSMVYITGVSLARYSYLQDADRRQEFIDYIQYRKAFIDKALELLEDFGIDFKFYNTYGPSKMFTIGHLDTPLDRVCLTMKFIIKLLDSSDKSIIVDIKNSIKKYIENINNITSIHMSNLISTLTEEYNEDVEFIEFAGINNWDSTYQYLERKEIEHLTDVPEFLNIANTADFEPDIEITIV